MSELLTIPAGQQYTIAMNKMTIDSYWDPSKLTTAMWMDASDYKTITEAAGAVSQWDDKSGNDRHMLQAVGASQPLLSNRGQLNGLDVLAFFDGAESSMSLASPATWLPAEFTVFAVTLRPTYQSFNEFITTRGNSDSSADWSIGRGRLTNEWYINTSDGDAEDAHWTYSPAPHSNPMLSATQFQDPSSQLWLFGFDGGVNVKPDSRGIPDTPLTIGGFGNDSFFYGGDVAEVLIVTGSITTDDRQKLEGYLAWKWGIEASLTIGHPYESDGSLFGYY